MSKNIVDYQKLYDLTSSVTPLQDDCGKLCGSICCRAGEDQALGMYLFPGEECMFTGRENWLRWEMRDPAGDDFPRSWKSPVYFVRCAKPCPREQRPLSCRFFPLSPHLLRDGTLFLIHETMALPYSCPLIEKKMPLRTDFVDAVARCWKEMLKDPRLLALVKMDSLERENEETRPHVVWSGK